MKQIPCFQCKDRQVGCHGHCDKEKEFLEETHNLRILISEVKYQDFEIGEYEALRNTKMKK